MHWIHTESIDFGGSFERWANNLEVFERFVMAAKQVGEIVDECQRPGIFLADFL